MVPPSPPADEDAIAVCCMCGDPGLPRELFRCRSCRVRRQHRYCSDLYPRATAYRRCNWCLREPDEGGGAAGHAAAANNKQPAEKRKATTPELPAASGDEQRRRHEGCSRRPPPVELGHPVKNKHKADERVPPPTTAAPGAVKGSGTGSDGKELMRAGKTRVRVKVRRYKLLEEVISC